MVQYLDSDVLRRQSGTIHRLTAVTIVGLIGTIATGFLGMNLIAEAEAPLRVKLRYFSIVAGAVIVLTVGGCRVLAAADGAPRPHVRRAPLSTTIARLVRCQCGEALDLKQER